MSAPPQALGRSVSSTSRPTFRSQVRRRHWVVDLALLGSLLLLAFGVRLINLDVYSGLFDEGIRTEQLFLMSQGYRPFRDIFAAQGPLLLDAWYPLYAAFSLVVQPPLAAARLAAVAYSLVGLAGIYWLGRQLAGRPGGFAAALILALSPLYLEGSRLALAEVPALAPAILALGCALKYGERGDRRWLAGAGLLLTLSLLMKPITLAAALAVAVAALLRGQRGVRDLVLVGAAMLGLSLVAVWLLGFNEVRDQILAYREAARQAADWTPRKNLEAIQRGFALEARALLPLAAFGAIVLLLAHWRRALPAVVWAFGGLLLLLAYSPLHGKHLVVAIPALALLAGAGLVRSSQVLARYLPPRARALAAAPLAIAGLWYAVGLAPGLTQAGQVPGVTRDTDVDPAFEQYADAVATLQALTGPDDFLVTDQPYLAFLAQRKVPPELVDTALSRIRSRSLTGAKAQSVATAYGPQVVLFWGDRLRSLPTFKSWVENEYVPVKIYNRRGDSDRVLYLRRDLDLEAARRTLAAQLSGGPSATFAAELRLESARLDRAELAQGQGANVSMLWEQLAPSRTDYHVLVSLRRPDGRSVDDQEESLGGGGAGTSSWAPGRWLVQSSFVRTDDLPPGPYAVTLSLYDSRARAIIPIDGQPGSNEVMVGALTVR